MARVPPYHTFAVTAPPKAWVVYHDDDTCPEGQTIPRRHREVGTGLRTLCERCRRIHYGEPARRSTDRV